MLRAQFIGLWLLVVLIIACGCNEQEGSVHLIHAFDTEDPLIGESCKNDIGSMSRAFLGFSKRLAGGKAKVIKGKDFTWKVITQAVDSLRVGNRDSVVLTISCHGVTAEGKHKLLAGGVEMDRAELLETLKKKGGKLTVLLTDACAVARQSNSRTLFTIMDSGEENRILLDLFVRSEGTVDINAASEGEAAFGDDSSGGLFSSSFVWLCARKHQEVDLNGDSRISWADEAFPLLKRRVQLGLDGLRKVAQEQNKPSDRGVQEILGQKTQTAKAFGDLPR